MTGRPLHRGLAVIGVAALITVTGCGDQPSDLGRNVEKSSIRVGVPDTVDAAPLYLARQEGYFAEVGLSVEIVKITADRAQSVLEAKEPKDRVDIALGDYVPIFQELEGGADLRILAEGYAAGPGVLQIMTTRDSGIGSVVDLQNRKVAVDPSYPLGKLSLAQTLASKSVVSIVDGVVDLETGLPLTIVEMPFKQMAGALEDGTVDAAWMLEPYVSAAEQTIGARKLADAAEGSLSELPLSGYMVTESWAKRYRGTGAAFVSALQKAQELATRNPGKVRTVLPSYTKITKVTAALVGIGTYPISNNAARLQRVVDLMARYGMLTGDLIIHDYLGPAATATPSPTPTPSG
ncbi:MAG: ABC transporter substrate-binding protein [Sporichthyaceae bacterium]|nr:ABC transporter substrate-binding protein [Sporichthyaceae bacterium]